LLGTECVIYVTLRLDANGILESKSNILIDLSFVV
jgi:hypothetical protein